MALRWVNLPRTAKDAALGREGSSGGGAGDRRVRGDVVDADRDPPRTDIIDHAINSRSANVGDVMPAPAASDEPTAGPSSRVRRMSVRASALELVLHPVRLRILQAVAGRTMTTAELAELLADVAAATVYRHVNALLEAGVLKVVSERRVRGAVERTLALVDDAAQAGPDEVRNMSEDQHRQAFAVFLAHQAAEFDRFIALRDEGSMPLFGYGQTILHVTEDDLRHIQDQLRAILEPYLRPRENDRHRVSLATLLIPESSSKED